MNGAMIRSPCNMSAARGSASEGFVNALDIKADQAVEHRLLHRDPLTIAQCFPWARGKGQTWIHRSDDGGRTFAHSSRIDTRPFSGGYGIRGAIELPDGEIILPLCDVPHYRNVFVVRSRDGGESWSGPEPVAGAEGHEFEEPAPLLLISGRLIMLLRDNRSRILHLVRSEDEGHSWTVPRATGIIDYPAHL